MVLYMPLQPQLSLHLCLLHLSSGSCLQNQQLQKVVGMLTLSAQFQGEKGRTGGGQGTCISSSKSSAASRSQVCFALTWQNVHATNTGWKPLQSEHCCNICIENFAIFQPVECFCLAKHVAANHQESHLLIEVLADLTTSC